MRSAVHREDKTLARLARGVTQEGARSLGVALAREMYEKCNKT
jgi:hypothetical protein